MSYIALYREWRPARFADVVEQEHVVKTLRYSVNTGRIAHAYLFCGTRGTGKTTMAKILSRAINCLDPKDGEPCNECEVCREILSGSSVDVIEIDAASNNSVDNVRSIRDEVIYAPTKAKRKVYIIDEVHMLSTGAFNALLKTLEEPPEHVVFILATTEPHKLPATILSRCQRFDFRRISQESIIKRLQKITSAGDASLDADAAKLIARMSDGAMRDAISLLDQCMSLGNRDISYNDVLSVVGIVNDTFMTSFTDCMLEKRIPSVLENVALLVEDGRDISHFVSDLVLYFRNLLICKSTAGACENLIDVPHEVMEVIRRQSGMITLDETTRCIRELSALESSLKWAANPRVLLEVTLVKLCGSISASEASIADRLDAIERRLDSGDFRITAPSESSGTAGGGSFKGVTAMVQDDSNKTSRIPQAMSRDTSVDSEASGSRTDAGAGSGKESHPGDISGTDNSKATEYAKWQMILKHLKSLGRMTLYSYLLNAKALLLDEGTIGLVVKEGPIRASISRLEHIKLIEEAAAKIEGREMQIKCLEDDIVHNKAAREKPSESSDLLSRARSIADRTGLPLEIIDE
ncbi:MAG TPA: DNA polymerase III subunit gamma/tau [Clostridia bacterium]|nr:DNA polymerase III subunit gamma/tau [Clostridia bacterium]